MKTRHRLLIPVILFFILTSGYFLLTRYRTHTDLEMERIDLRLKNAGLKAFSEIISDQRENRSIPPEVRSKKLKKISREAGVDAVWSITDKNGKLVYISSAMESPGTDHTSKCLEIITISNSYNPSFSTGSPYAFTWSPDNAKVPVRSVIIPLTTADNEKMLIGSCQNLMPYQAGLRNHMVVSLLIAVCYLLGGTIVTAGVFKGFTKEAGRLSATLDEVLDGKREKEIPESEFDDLDMIVNVFNRMMERCDAHEAAVNQSRENLEIERHQLFSVFTGIEGTIYIADPDTYEVLFMNGMESDHIQEKKEAIRCYKIVYGFEKPCDFCTNDLIRKIKPETHQWDFFNTETNSHFAMIDRVINWPDGREVCFHFALNITERKEAEKKIQNLLEQSRKQAKELTARQKELRLVNEGLEIQTEALIRSEEDLKHRQEELANTNRILSEQSAQLEDQKKHLNEKNLALETAKKEVEKKAEELETTSRYKSDFLANMSHELRTPLNSILLLSKYLSEDTDNTLSTKQKECAETVFSAGNELLTLINEILDLARVESGNMIPEPDIVPVRDLATDMARTFRPVAEDKSLGFTVHVDTEVPETIRTDPLRLAQILRNLLSNAFKFTSKGSVTFEIEHSEPENRFFFHVKDTGDGIPKDKQEIIFHAFKQADGSISRKYGGTGLGLSISREYAFALNGQLTLNSSVGIGSVFTLSLPTDLDMTETESTGSSLISPTEADPQKEKESAEHSHETDTFVQDDREKVTKCNRSILVITDDIRTARHFRDAIRSAGWCALVAETSETGLYMTEAWQPDGIVLSMTLSGTKGKTTLFRLKENFTTRHIPVFVIPEEGQVVEPLRMGALGFFSRDEAPDSFADRFSNILNNGQKRVLVVEDNPATNRLITMMLDKIGVDSTVTRIGSEATMMLSKETFDCVILDLGLPDMSGSDLLKSIRGVYANHVPVIVHTSMEMTPDQLDFLDNHANRIVMKNDKSLEKLLDAILLYLHINIESLPEKEHRTITKLYDQQAILEGKKILIADDDMRNVFSLVSVLEEKGSKMIIAKNGLQALDMLDENPDTDLVLMDIMMPEMDGYTTIREIRKIETGPKRIPIIALTARAMKGDRARCIQVGANDYLSKPVDKDKLLSMLRVWLY